MADSPEPRSETHLPSIYKNSVASVGLTYSKGACSPGQVECQPDSLVKRLKSELQTTKNKAGINEQKQEALAGQLRVALEAQKQEVARQADEIRALQRSLKEYQVKDTQQQRSITKTNVESEAQIRALNQKVKDLELQHASELQAAREQYEHVKRLKVALTESLGCIAEAALGGAEPDAEQLLADAEAAASEGGEALPRNSTVWAQLRYEVNASGCLVTVNRQPGTAAKPFDRDGARGIAALTAQVARLYRQRSSYKDASRDAHQQVGKLKSILDNVDKDFQVVSTLLRTMVDSVQRLLSHCGLPHASITDDLLSAGPRKVSERLQVVWQLLQHVCGALIAVQRGQAADQPAIADEELSQFLSQFEPMVASITDKLNAPRDAPSPPRRRTEGGKSRCPSRLYGVASPPKASQKSAASRLNARRTVSPSRNADNDQAEPAAPVTITVSPRAAVIIDDAKPDASRDAETGTPAQQRQPESAPVQPALTVKSPTPPKEPKPVVSPAAASSRPLRQGAKTLTPTVASNKQVIARKQPDTAAKQAQDAKPGSGDSKVVGAKSADANAARHRIERQHVQKQPVEAKQPAEKTATPSRLPASRVRAPTKSEPGQAQPSDVPTKVKKEAGNNKNSGQVVAATRPVVKSPSPVPVRTELPRRAAKATDKGLQPVKVLKAQKPKQQAPKPAAIEPTAKLSDKPSKAANSEGHAVGKEEEDAYSGDEFETGTGLQIAKESGNVVAANTSEGQQPAEAEAAAEASHVEDATNDPVAGEQSVHYSEEDREEEEEDVEDTVVAMEEVNHDAAHAQQADFIGLHNEASKEDFGDDAVRVDDQEDPVREEDAVIEQSRPATGGVANETEAHSTPQGDNTSEPVVDEGEVVQDVEADYEEDNYDEDLPELPIETAEQAEVVTNIDNEDTLPARDAADTVADEASEVQDSTTAAAHEAVTSEAALETAMDEMTGETGEADTAEDDQPKQADDDERHATTVQQEGGEEDKVQRTSQGLLPSASKQRNDPALIEVYATSTEVLGEAEHNSSADGAPTALADTLEQPNEHTEESVDPNVIMELPNEQSDQEHSSANVDSGAVSDQITDPTSVQDRSSVQREEAQPDSAAQEVADTSVEQFTPPSGEESNVLQDSIQAEDNIQQFPGPEGQPSGLEDYTQQSEKQLTDNEGKQAVLDVETVSTEKQPMVGGEDEASETVADVSYVLQGGDSEEPGIDAAGNFEEHAGSAEPVSTDAADEVIEQLGASVTTKNPSEDTSVGEEAQDEADQQMDPSQVVDVQPREQVPRTPENDQALRKVADTFAGLFGDQAAT